MMKLFMFLFFCVLFNSVYSQRFHLHADTFSLKRKSVLKKTGVPVVTLSYKQFNNEMKKFESSSLYWKQSKNQLWHIAVTGLVMLGGITYLNRQYKNDDISYFPRKNKYYTYMTLITVPLTTVMFYKYFQSNKTYKKALKAYNFEVRK